jgi:hypothetical protein
MPDSPAVPEPPKTPKTVASEPSTTLDLVERRYLVAGGVIALGIGIMVGFKLGGGMETKTVEVPVRTPCKNCAERERLAQLEASTPAPAVTDAPAPPPAPVPPLPGLDAEGRRVFSRVANGSADAAAEGVSDGTDIAFG